MNKAQVVVTFDKPDSEQLKINKAATFCRERIRQSAQAILDCGHRLMVLKRDLKEDHKWLAAFGEVQGRKCVGENPFPWGSRTADTLIQIHAKLSSGNTLPPEQLPQSWYTLRELAQLEPARLEQMREKIHPTMTSTEARALKPKAKKKPPKPPSNQTIDTAHAVYMKIPKPEFLREVVALLHDKGLRLEDLRAAWEAQT